MEAISTSDPARAARSSRIWALPRYAVLCAGLAAFFMLALPAPAAAATPCWQRVINDWFDGRIDNTYPVKCYREAIKHLPEDAVGYSSAPDDIRRAMLAAIRDRRGGGQERGPAEYVPLPKNDTAGPVRSDEDGFFRELLARLGPKNADDVPIPLLVLAGIALLLLGTATASYVARWIQARRVQLAPARAKRPATRQQEQT